MFAPKNVPVNNPQKKVDAANTCINERTGLIVALIFLANRRYKVAPKNKNNPYPESPRHKPKNTIKKGAKNGVRSSSLYLGSI